MTVPYPFPARPWKTIHVSGSERSIGRQHAEQLGDEVGKGMPRFYHDLLAQMLSRKPTGWRDRMLWGAARSVIDPVLVNRLLKQVPNGFRERVSGMAEVANLSERELEIALVLPDLGPILQTAMARVMPSHFVSGVSSFRFGCSSFISRGDAFLVGRNLDFPGVAYWDRYPVLQSLTPEHGLKSIAFTTAGVPVGGITGINEAQIFVALHQHYCRFASLSGRLPFILAEQILQKAQSLDQAIEILRAHPLASSWAFILADGKTRQGAIVEGTPKVRGIRRLDADGVVAHSNYFQTSECQPSEYATSARMNWDNYWRKARLEALVRANGAALDPSAACLALADHYDGHLRQEKASNRTVSQLYNIQSVVVDPVNMHAWIAGGDAPIHLREFEKFDLGAVLEGGSGATGQKSPGFRFKDAALGRAKEAFIVSFINAMDGDSEGAYRNVQASLQEAFTPEIALTASILAMKSGETRKAADWLARASQQLRDRCSEISVALPPEYFEVRLFEGRVADLLGDSTQAQKYYQEVARHADLQDTNLKRIATRARAYRPQDVHKLLMPYSTYVPFN